MAERERIARDLHDTLLQSTQGLVLSLQAEVDRIPPADLARARLEHILERAETLAEGRSRVVDLRVPSDVQANLAEALGSPATSASRG